MIENRHTIILAILSRHLTAFASPHVTETIPLERTTFPVIPTPTRPDDGHGRALNDLISTRYGRTSELALKHSCTRMREEFHALETVLPEAAAVLDGMMRNTYILLIVHDPTICVVCFANALCDYGR